MTTVAPAWARRGGWLGTTVGLVANLVLWGWPTGLPAQPDFKLKGFMFPDYYPATSTTQTNQLLKSVVTGTEAEQVPGGWKITEGRSKTFRLDGRQELEVNTTGCFLDVARHEVSGSGHLTVTNASTLSSIEGEGFFWRQSDGFMIISNRVLTVVQRGLLTAGSLGEAGVTNASVAASQAATGQVVRITSDRGVFFGSSNRLEQTGHVVADDAQAQLGCESLRVQFIATRRLQEMVAEQEVQLLNKADQSRVTAGRAIYRFSPERETIVLTERPSWQDREGGQWVKAARFTYDLNEHSLLGEGGATMQLPRSGFLQPGATNAPAAGRDTNHVQVTAETLTLWLASTNRPHRRAIAEKGVVVVSAADDLRATGDRLVFQEETGLAELLGHATWSAEGRVARADTLVIDRTNQVFRGLGHAFFRLPLQSLGQAAPIRAGTNRMALSNVFLEIRSDDFAYRTNTLMFQGVPARGRLLEGDTLRGIVTCGTLAAHFSNRFDRLLAEQHVVVENYPPPGTNGLAVTNLLTCERLAARLSESGEAMAVVASENVQAAQIQSRTAPGKSMVSDLTCGLLTAVMLPTAGRVDKLQAEQHVVISQGDKRARAETALYTDRENRVTLAGRPYVEFAGGTVTGADPLVWDRSSGAFQGRGKYRIEWSQPAVPTNLPGFLFLKK